MSYENTIQENPEEFPPRFQKLVQLSENDVLQEVRFFKYKPSQQDILLNEDNHTDEMAIFIRESIIKYCTDLVKSNWVNQHYPEKFSIDSWEDINSGHCEAVIVHIFDSVAKSTYDENRIVFNGLKKRSVPLHYWLQYETRTGEYFYFDSEAPWGVKEWEQLPVIQFFQRQSIDYTQYRHDVDPRDDEDNTIRGFHQCYK